MHRWELGRQDRISTHASAVLTRAVARTSLLKVANCAPTLLILNALCTLCCCPLSRTEHTTRAMQGKKQSSIQVALQRVALALKKRMDSAVQSTSTAPHPHTPRHSHARATRRASTRTPHSFRHMFGQLVEWQVLPCCVTRAYTAVQNVCARALYLLHPHAYTSAQAPTHIAWCDAAPDARHHSHARTFGQLVERRDVWLHHPCRSPLRAWIGTLHVAAFFLFFSVPTSVGGHQGRTPANLQACTCVFVRAGAPQPPLFLNE
jgi:hypothetical protein